MSRHVTAPSQYLLCLVLSVVCCGEQASPGSGNSGHDVVPSDAPTARGSDASNRSAADVGPDGVPRAAADAAEDSVESSGPDDEGPPAPIPGLDSPSWSASGIVAGATQPRNSRFAVGADGRVAWLYPSKPSDTEPYYGLWLRVVSASTGVSEARALADAGETFWLNRWEAHICPLKSGGYAAAWTAPGEPLEDGTETNHATLQLFDGDGHPVSDAVIPFDDFLGSQTFGLFGHDDGAFTLAVLLPVGNAPQWHFQRFDATGAPTTAAPVHVPDAPSFLDWPGVTFNGPGDALFGWKETTVWGSFEYLDGYVQPFSASGSPTGLARRIVPGSLITYEEDHIPGLELADDGSFLAFVEGDGQAWWFSHFATQDTMEPAIIDMEALGVSTVAELDSATLAPWPAFAVLTRAKPVPDAGPEPVHLTVVGHPSFVAPAQLVTEGGSGFGVWVEYAQGVLAAMVLFKLPAPTIWDDADWEVKMFVYRDD